MITKNWSKKNVYSCRVKNVSPIHFVSTIDQLVLFFAVQAYSINKRAGGHFILKSTLELNNWTSTHMLSSGANKIE